MREREMKILCDVCGTMEAAVLCYADEAALCHGCDRRVHHANRLASKHPRFSLLCSSAQPHPLCDVCQERRGFLFCKEDRAILCHECDTPIHTANDLTMKHSRFIFTGTRLSAAPITASLPSSEESISKKKVFEPFSSPMEDRSSSSNISEYLITMLPGYRVEDFLLEDSINYSAGDVFCQNDALAPLVENIGVASAADWNFSVPVAPPHIHQPTSIISATANVVMVSSNKETSGAHHLLASLAAAPATIHGRAPSTTEEVFTVPQLPSVPGSNKRPCRPWPSNF